MKPQRKYNKEIVPTARMLRKNMTKEEKRLWYDFLRTYPVKFSRQKVLGKYIADFYCAAANLVIELDGNQHYTEIGSWKDEQRTKFLKDYGIKVIRFKNYEIRECFRRTCEKIEETVNNLVEEKETRHPNSPSVTCGDSSPYTREPNESAKSNSDQ